jgi:hypothetical protein
MAIGSATSMKPISTLTPIGEEIVVFEIAEQAEIGGDRDPQHGQPLGAILEMVDRKRGAIIEHRADQQQQREFRPPRRIEKIARCHQEDFLPGVMRVEKPGDRIDDGEEDRKSDGGKQHLLLRYAVNSGESG